MTIDWTVFSPWSALAGGVLIGIAAAIFILGDLVWRAAFLLGLLVSPMLYLLFTSVPEPRIDAEHAALIAAGLLVGAGTRYGSGCTSGHGVYGLSRLSPRSLAATAAFMSAGFATVYVTRHLFAL